MNNMNSMMHTGIYAALGIGFVGALPLVGCSSTSTRPSTQSGASTNEIDPALAYSNRRRAEALEHYNAASSLHLSGQPDEALSEYRKALELNNQLYAAWNNMGELLMSQEQYADAVSAFQIASGIELTDPRPQYNIGLAYQRVGWASDSYTHFRNAIDRDANYLPALRGLISSAEMLGKGDHQILEYIRNAQLRETDTQWRDYFSTQYYRVEAIIANKNKN